MTAKVATIEPGMARLGMMVADTFRRKRKITRTTRATVAISVNFTSCTDSRIMIERSARTSSVRAAGSCSASVGSSALTPSTTCTTLLPGCLLMASVIARAPLNQPPILSFSTPS